MLNCPRCNAKAIRWGRRVVDYMTQRWRCFRHLKTFSTKIDAEEERKELRCVFSKYFDAYNSEKK